MLLFFFFNDTATTEIYTLSLHDALPILHPPRSSPRPRPRPDPSSRWSAAWPAGTRDRRPPDRKSTRLNSSHDQISYAVFCLKKKKCFSPAHQLDASFTYGGTHDRNRQRL